MTDAELMALAIDLSRQGFPAPNPRVGAVVAKDGAVLGTGFHARAGGAHAEAAALEEAGEAARGADLFVTLEPCDHHGRTPPCTEAILAADVRRVVFANADPNPAASGGADRLRGAGVAVEGGLLSAEAEDVNRVFAHRWRTGLPYVVVKAGVTLDGRIADVEGASKWITDEAARRMAHELRVDLGCVLVGATTAERDDPSLAARDVDGQIGLRAVLDPDRRLPDGLGMFVTDDVPTMRVVAEDRAQEGDFGARRLDSGALDLRAVLSEIAERGCVGVLVEGGGKTIGEFVRQGLVQEVVLFMAPKLFGAGVSWLDGPGRLLAEAVGLVGLTAEPAGDGLCLRARVRR